MAKADYVEFKGIVDKQIPGGKFLVTLENGHQVVAHLSGKMRLHKINILANDRVTVEVSAYDSTQGRITYRHK